MTTTSCYALFAVHKKNRLLLSIYTCQISIYTKPNLERKTNVNTTVWHYDTTSDSCIPILLLSNTAMYCKTNLKIKPLIATTKPPRKSSDNAGLASGMCNSCLHNITFFHEKYWKYLFARLTNSDFNLADIS